MPNRRDLSEEEYPLIENLAAEGVRERDICYKLGVHPDTWVEIKKRDPKALEAFHQGRGELHDKLVSKLVQNALKGDKVSIIFALKSMFGYVEGVDPQAADPGRVNITFNLPASVTPDQYQQLIRLAPKELQHERATD